MLLSPTGSPGTLVFETNIYTQGHQTVTLTLTMESLAWKTQCRHTSVLTAYMMRIKSMRYFSDDTRGPAETSHCFDSAVFRVGTRQIYTIVSYRTQVIGHNGHSEHVRIRPE